MRLLKYFPLIILVPALFVSSCSEGEKVPPAEDPDSNNLTVNDHDDYYTYAGEPEAVHYPNPLNILYNQGYVSAYDEVRGTPAWVAYKVFSVEEYITFDRPTRFSIDYRTGNLISHDDYTHSGYDRGHMAPNFAVVTRYGQEAQIETFLMTNIIPQKPSLNRHWWQRLERLIARDYSEAYDNVWVITGPVYKEAGNWMHESKVKIPSHNFKIIKAEKNGTFEMKAFIVHQEVGGTEDHAPYLTSVNYIEEVTGLNFNPLMKQVLADSLESHQTAVMW